MIGIDTNVLVRFLTQDDPEQSALASDVFERELSARNPGFIGLVVLAETVWVLQSAYDATSDEVLDIVADLLQSAAIVVERRDVVSQALVLARQRSCGFADALIVAAASGAGCGSVLSFDIRAERAGMTLLQ